MICLQGCSSQRGDISNEKPALYLLNENEYPDFEDDINFEGLARSIKQSLSYYRRFPDEKYFYYGQDKYKKNHIIKTLKFMLAYIKNQPDKDDLNHFIKTKFNIYKSIGEKETGNVLFTGYYEAFLYGSLKKNSIYKYPVYGFPRDMVSVNLSLFLPEYKGKKIIGKVINKNIVPYYTREEIAEGNIIKKYAKPIVWVNDKVDLFFLEIQGSGIIFLDNGENMKVHYHASNGRPYRSIGKYLIDKGKIKKEDISLQSIRRYLKRNPDEMSQVLNYNKSYVFFQKEIGGPYGCINVELTPKRSIATDIRIFPKGGLAFIETQEPIIDENGIILDWVDFKRFVTNQDTGGAICGPGRVDIFMGNGPHAEISAGHLQHYGSLFFFVLKE